MSLPQVVVIENGEAWADRLKEGLRGTHRPIEELRLYRATVTRWISDLPPGI